ncbi:excisionase family DNA binding protein [Sphingomonas vulcanisoli]|uniref:Excisionase family DNA binding protein n=1 Tax=Sphingomonas vulcanisoli TaxID=1658060 RepID=A0ABX0TWU8_9SPHN|nr:helix-turn-helix domain-containing protein [Sphingomonas vulcanisoli]NIJ09528.1 excisionase family DNA binding protein [Sphingomonas vulcanisoli]
MRVNSDPQTRTANVSIEPLTVRIPTAVQLTGLSRSRIYELIEAGDLDIVKVGRSTLIPFKSLRRLIGEQV